METKKVEVEVKDKASDDVLVDGVKAVDLNKKEEIQKVKELRVKVDGLRYILRNTFVSKLEVMYAVNELTLIRGWLGEVLVYLGEPAPNSSEIHTLDDVTSDTDLSETIKVTVKKVDNETKKETVRDATVLESINHVKNDMGNIGVAISNIKSISTTVFATYLYGHIRVCKMWVDEYLWSEKNGKLREKLGKAKLPKRPDNKVIPLIVNKQGKFIN